MMAGIGTLVEAVAILAGKTGIRIIPDSKMDMNTRSFLGDDPIEKRVSTGK